MLVSGRVYFLGDRVFVGFRTPLDKQQTIFTAKKHDHRTHGIVLRTTAGRLHIVGTVGGSQSGEQMVVVLSPCMCFCFARKWR